MGGADFVPGTDEHKPLNPNLDPEVGSPWAEPEGPCQNTTAHNGACKDYPYALLFILNNVVLVSLLAINYDAAYFKAAPVAPGATTTDTVDGTTLYTCIGVSLGCGLGLSFGWILALQTCPRTLIQVGLGFAVAMPA